MDQKHDEHQFLAGLPIKDADTFNGEFGFIEAEIGLDLPSAVIAQDNAPGILDRKDRFVGQQEPGWRPAHGRETTIQNEWLGMLGSLT